jgi:23S rRNA (pseudouridine1915-N3)-methyltransferase
MKIELLALGKTSEKYLKSGIDDYVKRLSHFKPQIKYREISIPTKIYSWADQFKALEAEAELVHKNISEEDYLTLLDDKGNMYTSVEFSRVFEKMLVSSHRKWTFLIGGPYGFSPSIRERAQSTLSLSRMTFSHQIVRLIALEQLYRVQTIIHNQSYHHD